MVIQPHTWHDKPVHTSEGKYHTCPATHTSDEDLLTKRFKLTQPMVALVTVRIPRKKAGNAGLRLFVDGEAKAGAYTHTPTAVLEHANVFWAGTLAAGEHVVTLKPNASSNAWGCDGPAQPNRSLPRLD